MSTAPETILVDGPEEALEAPSYVELTQAEFDEICPEELYTSAEIQRDRPKLKLSPTGAKVGVTLLIRRVSTKKGKFGPFRTMLGNVMFTPPGEERPREYRISAQACDRMMDIADAITNGEEHKVFPLYKAVISQLVYLPATLDKEGKMSYWFEIPFGTTVEFVTLEPRVKPRLNYIGPSTVAEAYAKAGIEMPEAPVALTEEELLGTTIILPE